MKRVGAVLLPLSVVVFVIATAVMHPHREDPMHHQAVFLEYAQRSDWIAIHLAQWFAAMSLCGGLIAICYSMTTNGRDGGTVAARFGLVASLLTASTFTMLQAVDGVALKWAVDAWATAPAATRESLFAAAMSLRWTEYAIQSYSNMLLGLTLLFFGWAIAFGTGYPRWLGWGFAGSGVAWIVHGVMVSYIGLFDSTPRLVAIVLLAVSAFVLSFLILRQRSPAAARGG